MPGTVGLAAGLDQVLMDPALHRLGVTLVLGRSEVTGDDGSGHTGPWDLAVLEAAPHHPHISIQKTMKCPFH
ncbi:hypothetical protein [Streptomyces adustus]